MEKKSIVSPESVVRFYYSLSSLQARKMDNSMSELILHSMRGLQIYYVRAATNLHRAEADFDQVGQELVKVTEITFAACREDEKRSRPSA